MRLVRIDLKPAHFRAAFARQQLHQRAVAAADIEHLRAMFNHSRNHKVIAAWLSIGEVERCRVNKFKLRHQRPPPLSARPRAVAAESMKPVSAASNAGSCPR